MEQKAFWDIPYPELIVALFRKIFPWRLTVKERSPRGTRRLLCVLAVASLVLIWIVEGFVNPLEYLVDMPAFDLQAIVDAYPDDIASFYYMWLLIVTMIVMTVLKRVVCSEKEFPIWTVDGWLYWVVSLGAAILADAITRNIIVDLLYLPFIQKTEGSAFSNTDLFLMLLLMHFLFYFVIEDFASNGIAVMLTPYAITAYDKLLEPTGFLDIQLVKFIILTMVLKLILLVLEKLGITKLLSDLLKTFSYTLAGIPKLMLFLIAFPIWPFLLIWWLIWGRKKKKKATQQIMK